VDIELDELIRRRADVVVLDVRSDGEYTGATGYPCDPRQGHIPGARHVELSQLFDRTREEIQELVGRPPGAEVVTYCHSGSRSALAAELLRAAGYEARNYTGSWHEWSRQLES